MTKSHSYKVVQKALLLDLIWQTAYEVLNTNTHSKYATNTHGCIKLLHMSY